MSIPRYWHGREVLVLYAVVAKVNEKILTFYVASKYHSGVEADVTIKEQNDISEEWKALLGTDVITVVSFRWVSV